MPTPEEIARRLERFEEGLANAAIEGHSLDPQAADYARSLIARGLDAEARRDAMNAYFGVSADRARRAGG